MLDKHEGFARRTAAADGAQVVCFQELFYGPYFGITQDRKYYRFAEQAGSPIVQRFAAVTRRTRRRAVLPIYEEAETGVYYNAAVLVDADGTILRKYLQAPPPHLDRFWRSSTSGRATSATRCSTPRSDAVGMYIC